MLDVYRARVFTGAPMVPTVTQLASAHADCGGTKRPSRHQIPTVLRDPDNVPGLFERKHSSTIVAVHQIMPYVRLICDFHINPRNASS